MKKVNIKSKYSMPKTFVDMNNRKVMCKAKIHGETVVGTAVCNGTDEMDVEFGKALAEARLRKALAQADRKYWRARKRELFRSILAELNVCEAKISRADVAINEADDDIDIVLKSKY